MIDSVTCKPTLYDGLFEYCSKRILCVATSTKNPLIKYTPALRYATEPVYAEAFSTVVIATASLVSSSIRTSLSRNSDI